MLDAIRCLRQNCSVICFPEGTRAEAGKVLPFNEGLFRVAIREKVPILAVAIAGSAAVLPRDSWIFGEAKVIRLRILPVVETEGWTEAGLQAPMVDRAGVRILGESAIPQGTRLSVERMKAGEGCWQWVRIDGVIRDMNRDHVNLALSVAAQNHLTLF